MDELNPEVSHCHVEFAAGGVGGVGDIGVYSFEEDIFA